MIVAITKIALVIVAAFVIFLFGVVAALFGVLDPRSTPGAELRKLAHYVDVIYSGARRALDTRI